MVDYEAKTPVPLAAKHAPPHPTLTEATNYSIQQKSETQPPYWNDGVADLKAVCS